MRGLRASLISFCTLLTLGARAETITDLELRTAYCAGVTRVQIEMLERNANEAKDKRSQGLLMQGVSAVRERHKRFADYLRVKITSVEERLAALPALKLAIEHGQQDERTCQEQEKEPGYLLCTDRCPMKSPEEWVACLNSCHSSPSCNRRQKCLEDFLPF